MNRFFVLLSCFLFAVGCASTQSELNGAKEQIANATASNNVTIQNIDSAAQKVATSQPAQDILDDLDSAKSSAVKTNDYLGSASDKVDSAIKLDAKKEGKLQFYKGWFFWTFWVPAISLVIGAVCWFVFTEANLPGWVLSVIGWFKKAKR